MHDAGVQLRASGLRLYQPAGDDHGPGGRGQDFYQLQRGSPARYRHLRCALRQCAVLWAVYAAGPAADEPGHSRLSEIPAPVPQAGHCRAGHGVSRLGGVRADLQARPLQSPVRDAVYPGGDGRLRRAGDCPGGHHAGGPAVDAEGGKDCTAAPALICGGISFLRDGPPRGVGPHRLFGPLPPSLLHVTNQKISKKTLAGKVKI